MFKVAILQKRSINEQIDKNIETIIMAMEEASENHADILLLPECFITGYVVCKIIDEVSFAGADSVMHGTIEKMAEH